MTNPIEAKTNTITGETVYEEMTDGDFAILLAEREAEAKVLFDKKEQEAAQASARSALLDKLGITADEAKLLLQ